MKSYNPCLTTADPLGYSNMSDLEPLVPGIFSDDETDSMPLLCQELGLPADAISVFKLGLDYKSFQLRASDMDISPDRLYDETESKRFDRLWDGQKNDPIPGVHTPCTNSIDCECLDCRENNCHNEMDQSASILDLVNEEENLYKEARPEPEVVEKWSIRTIDIRYNERRDTRRVSYNARRRIIGDKSGKRVITLSRRDMALTHVIVNGQSFKVGCVT